MKRNIIIIILVVAAAIVYFFAARRQVHAPDEELAPATKIGESPAPAVSPPIDENDNLDEALEDIKNLGE